jgi:cell division protein FtsZ
MNKKCSQSIQYYSSFFFDLNADKSVSNVNRVGFALLEEDEEKFVPTAQQPIPVAGNEELMAMSEFIKNLDVTFEIVSPLKDIDYLLLQR